VGSIAHKLTLKQISRLSEFRAIRETNKLEDLIWQIIIVAEFLYSQTEVSSAGGTRMDRRMFLSWIGMGALASSLPMAIAACGLRDSKQTSASGPFTSVGSVAQLDQTGQLLVTNGVPNPVLVVRQSADPSGLVAVNPTCTHAGCTVQWKADAKTFNCPCHGARYDAQGAVIQGPARRSLKTYAVQIEGDQVMVQEN
jgi:cytochrome b6-f complex iron-sulfur subunit